MGALPFIIRAKRAGVWARTKDYSRGRNRGRGTRNTRRTRCFIGRGEKIERKERENREK